MGKLIVKRQNVLYIPGRLEEMSRRSSEYMDYLRWICENRLNLLLDDANPDDTLQIPGLARAKLPETQEQAHAREIPFDMDDVDDFEALNPGDADHA